MNLANSMEARLWLKTVGKGIVGFNSSEETLHFIDELYWAGAVEVLVSDSGSNWSIDTPFADLLIALLPENPQQRQNLISIYNQELERCGEDFGGEPNEYDIITKEQAQALGDPSLEGELSVRVEPLKDKGQLSLTFGWD